MASTSPAGGTLEVSEVLSAADRKAFIEFQYTRYAGDAAFVPPLRLERKEFLDPRKNSWFKFGTAALFLARREGRVVGRISASEDPRYNEFQGTRTGCFGLFESIDDQEVARALLETARQWVSRRGLTHLMGPVSFSSNQEWGLLIDGFQHEPYLLTPHNPPYYQRLLEGCGLTKAKDLWAWEIELSRGIPEQITRISQRVQKREGLVLRTARMRDWDEEVARIKRIYNSAWEKNWGFVPMTDDEFAQLARELRLIVRPELALFAEVKGEPVAFALTLPDANQAIRAAAGNLFSWGLPIGLIRLLLALRKVRRGRLIILGISPGYRKRGLDSVLIQATFDNALKLGWTGGEISWTLEDNDLINRPIAAFGCQRYKTYRVFETTLEAPPAQG